MTNKGKFQLPSGSFIPWNVYYLLLSCMCNFMPIDKVCAILNMAMQFSVERGWGIFHRTEQYSYGTF